MQLTTRGTTPAVANNTGDGAVKKLPEGDRDYFSKPTPVQLPGPVELVRRGPPGGPEYTMSPTTVWLNNYAYRR